MYVLAEDKESRGARARRSGAFAYHKRGAGDVAVALKARAEELKPGSVRNYEVQSLLRSGQQPPPPVEEPEAAGDDDDVPANPGPPLLPSLRGDVGRRASFERFPDEPSSDCSRSTARIPAVSRDRRACSAGEIEGLPQQAQEKVRTGDADGPRSCSTRQRSPTRRSDVMTTPRPSTAASGKSQSTTSEVLERWLANCERREDKREAAIVACELGDRAIARGEVDRAQDWF